MLSSAVCLVQVAIGTSGACCRCSFPCYQLILCTRLCVYDSRHAAHNGLRKPHVSISSHKSSQHFHQWRLDAFSIPHYVIRNRRPRGARHGKTEAQKQHFSAHNARRRCIKKNFNGIHGRFQRNSENRDSQLKIGWTEEKCIEMDKLAQEDVPIAHPLRSTRDIRKTGISH